MPKIVGYIDLNGQMLYSDYNSRMHRRKATRWYVCEHYTTDPSAFSEKCCGSRQAAEKWALSKKRVKEYGENAEFFIIHA